MAHGVLIVNPFASAVTEAKLEAVARELQRVGSLEVLMTQRAGHAVELAREAAPRADALFVFSGDGGFNEVLNGVDGETPLGFVPGGGTSVLPRALGFPTSPTAAASRLAEAAVAGRSRRISLGRVNGRRFGFSAGIGLDAELVRRVEALGRTSTGRRAGDAVFVFTALRMLAQHRATFEPALEVRGLGRAAFALVANCDPYSYAGRVPLHVAPEAEFECGLDVAAPRAVVPRTVVRFLRYLVRGDGQQRDPDILYAHDLDRIEVDCDRPLPLQADGEDLGDVTEAVFEADRGAVLVLRGAPEPHGPGSFSRGARR